MFLCSFVLMFPCCSCSWVPTFPCSHVLVFPCFCVLVFQFPCSCLFLVPSFPTQCFLSTSSIIWALRSDQDATAWPFPDRWFPVLTPPTSYYLSGSEPTLRPGDLPDLETVHVPLAPFDLRKLFSSTSSLFQVKASLMSLVPTGTGQVVMETRTSLHFLINNSHKAKSIWTPWNLTGPVWSIKLVWLRRKKRPQTTVVGSTWVIGTRVPSLPLVSLKFAFGQVPWMLLAHRFAWHAQRGVSRSDICKRIPHTTLF